MGFSQDICLYAVANIWNKAHAVFGIFMNGLQPIAIQKAYDYALNIFDTNCSLLLSIHRITLMMFQVQDRNSEIMNPAGVIS